MKECGTAVYIFGSLRGVDVLASTGKFFPMFAALP